nr:ribonuclease H-like domain-containing protein [Tanacetum cinerariifolium]
MRCDFWRCYRVYRRRTLAPDRVFEFPMDEPHPAYDFFAPGPLTGYTGNPNNTNGWIDADVSLLGELGEPLGPEMVALAMDMKEDPAVLFGDDDDSGDDDSEGPEGDEEVWEVNEEWLMAPVTPPPMLVIPPPSTYEVVGSSNAAAEGHSLTLLAPGVLVPPSVIEDLCTRMGNLKYGYGLLVKKVITVSDAEVADSIAIGQIGPRVSTVEDQMQVMASQMVQLAIILNRLNKIHFKGLTSVPSPSQQIAHTVSSIKLPILKKGEYDIWAMKMEHYLSHTDYPIWQVIQNGNGPVSFTTDTNGMIKVLPPKTAKEVMAREREKKARTTLLMALPEDHLAKFHKMADAKEMWEA